MKIDLGDGFLGCQGHLGYSNPYFLNGRLCLGDWQRWVTMWPSRRVRYFWWRSYLRIGD
jgi:hypothetical protein